MRQLTELGHITPQEPSSSPIESAPHIIVGLRGLVQSHRNRPFNIAILSRSRIAGIQQVVQSLIDHMNLNAPNEFLFTWFDGKNDEKKTMEHAMHIISNYTMPYDAVVTIGSLPTKIASRVSLLLNVRIPIIFTSTINHSHLGFVYPVGRSSHNITGISLNTTDDGTRIAMLQHLKKGVKNVLLPYDPRAANVYVEINEMTRLFLSRNIHIQLLPIHNTENIVAQITPFIHYIDTVITMRHEIIVHSISQIISLCNNFGVTLYSSDLTSVQLGAAIGFSPKESTQGIEAAQYLLMIFKENARPDELPVKEIPTVHFVGINEASLSKQGIVLSAQELDTIQNKILYKKEQP